MPYLIELWIDQEIELINGRHLLSVMLTFIDLLLAEADDLPQISK